MGIFRNYKFLILVFTIWFATSVFLWTSVTWLETTVQAFDSGKTKTKIEKKDQHVVHSSKPKNTSQHVDDDVPANPAVTKPLRADKASTDSSTATPKKIKIKPPHGSKAKETRSHVAKGFPPDPPFHGPEDILGDHRWVALCAIARYELPYIDEWVDYNIGIGFGHIYIYDNDPSNPLSDWVVKTNRTHNTQIIPYKEWFHDPKGLQRQSYTSCLESLRKLDHPPKWVAFFDVDEFLVMPKYTKVKCFLDDYLWKGALLIHQLKFGTSNETSYRDEPVVKRFTHRVSYSIDVKTIGVLSHIETQHIHTPTLDPNHNYLVRVGGDNNTTQSYGEQEWYHRDTAPAYLNHYKYKSEEEMDERRCRQGRIEGNNAGLNLTDPKGNYLKTFWRCNATRKAGTIFDDTAWQILKRNVPKYAELYPDK